METDDEVSTPGTSEAPGLSKNNGRRASPTITQRLDNNFWYLVVAFRLGLVESQTSILKVFLAMKLVVVMCRDVVFCKA